MTDKVLDRIEKANDAFGYFVLPAAFLIWFVWFIVALSQR